MKKWLLIIILTAIFAPVKAQKLVYVDSEYILGHIPEYVSAQKQLDAIADFWQKEAEGRQREIDRLKQSYQADAILLTDELKRKREEEISIQETEIREFQKDKFGYDGALFKERKKLMKPIHDKIAVALKVYAETEKIDIIIDKCSADGLLLFGSPRYDKSDEVLRKMGYKPSIVAKVEDGVKSEIKSDEKQKKLKTEIDQKVEESTKP